MVFGEFTFNFFFFFRLRTLIWQNLLSLVCLCLYFWFLFHFSCECEQHNAQSIISQNYNVYGLHNSIRKLKKKIIQKSPWYTPHRVRKANTLRKTLQSQMNHTMDAGKLFGYILKWKRKKKKNYTCRYDTIVITKYEAYTTHYHNVGGNRQMRLQFNCENE